VGLSFSDKRMRDGGWSTDCRRVVDVRRKRVGRLMIQRYVNVDFFATK
jgi:hypothetical protein